MKIYFTKIYILYVDKNRKMDVGVLRKSDFSEEPRNQSLFLHEKKQQRSIIQYTYVPIAFNQQNQMMKKEKSPMLESIFSFQCFICCQNVITVKITKCAKFGTFTILPLCIGRFVKIKNSYSAYSHYKNIIIKYTYIVFFWQTVEKCCFFYIFEDLVGFMKIYI